MLSLAVAVGVEKGFSVSDIYDISLTSKWGL
jgi:hypothetical protein